MFTQYNQPVHISEAARQALIDIRKRMEARRAPLSHNLRHRTEIYARIEAYRKYLNALRSSQRSKSPGQT